jgi:hypothetical protein
MSVSLASLNLRPQERRLVVLVAIVFFVVLNIWLVWPHFGDWANVQLRRERAEKTLGTYSAEVAKMKGYQVKLRELESAGSSVVPEEQELDFVRTVDSEAHLNKLLVIQSDPRPRVSANTQTNRFFEEQYETLHVNSGNEELINFLVSLASTNSLIRVKDLSLKVADAGSTKLDGQMTLVASYKRTTPTRGAAAVTVAPATLTTGGKKASSNGMASGGHTTTRTKRTGAPAFSTSLTNKLATARVRSTNAPAKK